MLVSGSGEVCLRTFIAISFPLGFSATCAFLNGLILLFFSDSGLDFIGDGFSFGVVGKLDMSLQLFENSLLSLPSWIISA